MSCFDEYEIGWICQLDDEYVIAKAFLDQSHDEPDLAPNDTNVYTLGRIGKRNVVVAISGKRDWGLSTVAITATHMIRSFPNIKSFLLVTITGGAPSMYHDIRLGDIVVSAPRNGDAVFQFDYGRTIQGQDFIPKKLPTTTPMFLQIAVNRLKDRYRLGTSRLEDSINSVLDKNPMLRDHWRPDPASDILFFSHYNHQGESDCCIDCEPHPSNVVMRHARTEQKNNPVIHYGRIASGNRVIRDALFRDKLSKQENVLCFEAGAAGVMSDFPCLAICGISDYSDTHRPLGWDRYAAVAAAAYARDLIQIIPAENGKDIDGSFSRRTVTMKGRSKILFSH